MYQSADYTKSYSVGDTYDPTNKTKGIKDKNVIITGAGTYTVSLDFTECGEAKGVAFSALGISDDKHCTRVNLYNAWVNDLPKEARTPDGDFTDCSAQIMDISDKTSVSNISITFTVHEP